MKASTRSALIETISILLILLFAYTAVSKLLSFKEFRWALSESPMIGKKWANTLAIALPVVELFIVALLLIPKAKLKGLLASFIMMIVFTLYLAYMILFTPELPCSCGGVIGEMSWRQHLVFNICFTFLAFAGWHLERKRLKANIQKDESAPVIFT